MGAERVLTRLPVAKEQLEDADKDDAIERGDFLDQHRSRLAARDEAKGQSAGQKPYRTGWQDQQSHRRQGYADIAGLAGYLHLGRVQVFLTLDVELSIGTALKLESDNDACVLGNNIPDNGEVGAQGLDCFDESICECQNHTKKGRLRVRP